MADIAMTTAVANPAEPDGAPRLAVLDILRGVAILGILFMNIPEMGGPISAGNDAVRDLGWTTADRIAWWGREILATGTARCMLEMLFGAGMVILTDRAATTMGEWRLLRAYAFRNVVLFLFGLVHVFLLLWPGDILHTYGLAALVAMLFRRAKPRLMLTVGLSLAVIQLCGSGYQIAQSKALRADVAAIQARQAHGRPPTPAERKQVAQLDKRIADRAKDRAQDARDIAAEDSARSSTPRAWVGAAWDFMLKIEGMGLEALFVWEAAATMLIGAALFRWGVLQGRRSTTYYTRMTLIAYAVGLSLRAWEAWAVTRFDHLPSYAYATYEVARLATTLGHLGLVNLLVASATGARLLKPFEAAGRTALSIYVGQTLICLWVLYPPWGFRLYHQQGWAALMLTAAAVDVALLALATWWVHRFAIAPVEWAWRSIIARQALPFRRGGDRARGRGGVPAAA